MFGIDVRIIREINRILDITPLPHSADYVRGLINLRGQIVTILDLGVRLGLPRKTTGQDSHNIILKGSSEAEHPIGFLVDAIGDVVDVEDARIEPLSANVGEAEGLFLSGVVKMDTGLLVLLNIRRVLDRQQQRRNSFTESMETSCA
jgi:purine-binding chemotaxis protein CheW